MTRLHRRAKTSRSRSSRPRASPDAIVYTPGIDVSHHQGAIDWARVAAAGIKYAYIKATEGASFIDARFAANWEGAADNNILRGAYHFFAPATVIVAQFENFINTVNLEAGDLAPVLDLEVDGQNWAALPMDDRVPASLELLQRLEEHYGIQPLVYTNRRTVRDVFGDESGELTRYPLWVASYKINPPPTMPAGWADWKYWQYSASGAVDGIVGAVDLNRTVGDPGPVLEGIPDTVWESIHELRRRLFPHGVPDADAHLSWKPTGRTSVDVRVRSSAGTIARRRGERETVP